jgi:fructokinase
MKKSHNAATVPVIFGEVLFDCFPDGNSVLGGAPFNVAWHLQGLGLHPLFISAVGKDAHGEQVRRTMQSWGMDMSGLQTRESFPTGQVTVSLEAGQPSYDIVADQAYDHIDGQQVLAAAEAKKCALIYHGSLALRHKVSRASLDALLASTQLPVFLDLNLRSPWWDKNQIDRLLARARWVKLNDEELFEVAGVTPAAEQDITVVAQTVYEHYELQWLIVTQGAEGAFILTPQGKVEGRAARVENLVDTVGAGDAFSAVTIAGLLQGWPVAELLQRALNFAAAVCQQRGATTENIALYR